MFSNRVAVVGHKCQLGLQRVVFFLCNTVRLQNENDDDKRDTVSWLTISKNIRQKR